ncbi:hypothetical protein BD410DRAFT_877227 [Rickenella mellea]|uniref:Uncharacterized protein n=1 Tax=Rickenella mellea TaxID=50990 RepID=A0A4Y7PWE6_9AGAM|nr:hypothetical protein BD410DRAFT_877227 [Rickenella mellea]
MPPSASKQKRLAEKAAKQASKGGLGVKDESTTGTSTPNGSVNSGSSFNTPMSSRSAATSVEDLNSMARLQILTDRSAAGVLVSDSKGRDVKIESFTLSFHGRLLIEGAEIALYYGQRYGLLGENGSGKPFPLRHIYLSSPPKTSRYWYLLSGLAPGTTPPARDGALARSRRVATCLPNPSLPNWAVACLLLLPACHRSRRSLLHAGLAN